jgi:hypothetical protein
VTAVGNISHDSDGNDEELADIVLDKLKEAGIRSTWCIIMPGYPDHIYKRIENEGHEIALHYDALGTEEGKEGHWSEQHFQNQLDMLKSQLPDRTIVSNRNHYNRWEGDSEFYRWCERSGIHVDKSRSGSKQGNKGFLFGTCHPNVPIGTPYERNRRFDVINLPTLAWDPPVSIRCTTEEAKALLRRSCNVYGVAHFLYHPGSTKRIYDNRTVGEFMVELCAYGYEQGLDWWTSKQIWHWYQLRRQVRTEVDGQEIRITSSEPVDGLTLMLPLFQSETLTVKSESTNVIKHLTKKERFGLPFMELILDLPAGITIFKLSSDNARRNEHA